MKKYIIYIAILALGLILGYVFFGRSSDSADANMTDSEHAHEDNQLWTCSMHPQIMQPEPGDCPICGMDLIPAESGGEGLAMNEIKMSENAMALANIQTTIVGDATESDGNQLSLSGKIMANEEANAVQASYFEGRIEKLNVNFTGEEVRKGQLLATIYAPTLVAAQQELLTAASLKASQPALYNAVRNKLKLWKLSESQINQIESSGKVRENFPIYATVSGTVSQKMAEEGDYVKQGQPIVKVSDLGTVWAVFDTYENQISQLKEGQVIKVISNAYPNKEFDAKVSFIDPILNTKSRTVAVRATLNNKEDLLKPGMFVTGKLDVSKAQMTESTITVPASAILWTGERSLVYVKTNPNEPIFEMREVTLGNKNGDVYTITEGLSNGDEVVTNGTFTVDAAAQLQGKKSMMNQPKEQGEMASSMDMKMELSATFQKEFKKVFKPYLQMKDAFIASDAVKVSKYAKETLSEFKSLPIKELGNMEQSHISQIEKMLKTIIDNETLDNQRDHFVILNENMVVMAMNSEGTDAMLYVQQCPMANNNKGAVWLSAEKDIRNPYYGEAMLTCGSVINEIQ
jgi:Cu(I)/Ag(I) efflux system membrane fusion protein